MLGFLQSEPFNHPTLGTLTKRRGWWVGTLDLPRFGAVELRVAGNRKSPDARSLDLATTLPSVVRALETDIANALYEHYFPGLEVWRSGQFGERSTPFPEITGADGVWSHVHAERVEVNAAEKAFTIEIACTTAWDEEHTLGIRLKGDSMVELCGSIL
jgi:hypothetical protein